MIDNGGSRQPVLEFFGAKRKKSGALWRLMNTLGPPNQSPPEFCQQHSGSVYRIRSK